MFKSIKAKILSRRKSSSQLARSSTIKLTERNLGFFNNDGKALSDTLSIFESEGTSSKDASLKLQNSREIQISEWLRLVP